MKRTPVALAVALTVLATAACGQYGNVHRAAVVALHRDGELAAVRREAHLGRRLQKCRRVAVAEAERAQRPGNRVQRPARDAIALDVAGKAGVQYVGEVAVDADAGREWATRRHDLVQM